MQNGEPYYSIGHTRRCSITHMITVTVLSTGTRLLSDDELPGHRRSNGILGGQNPTQQFRTRRQGLARCPGLDCGRTLRRGRRGRRRGLLVRWGSCLGWIGFFGAHLIVTRTSKLEMIQYYCCRRHHHRPHYCW